MNQDCASTSGRLSAIKRSCYKDQRKYGPTVRANLRPSQGKLDRLEAAAINASDEKTEKAIRMLERSDYRRNRQWIGNIFGKSVPRNRRGTWGISLNLGIFSLHRRIPD